MPITVITGSNAAELTANVSDVLDTDNQPIGQVFIVGNSGVARQLCQLMGESDSTITSYQVVHADSLGALGSKLDTALGVQGAQLYNGIQILGDNVNLREFVQAVVIGDIGGGGGATLPAAGTTAEINTGTETALRMWAPKTIKDALPAAGSASDLQTGTATVARTWTAKAIHDEVARQIAAAP